MSSSTISLGTLKVTIFSYESNLVDPKPNYTLLHYLVSYSHHGRSFQGSNHRVLYSDRPCLNSFSLPENKNTESTD